MVINPVKRALMVRTAVGYAPALFATEHGTTMDAILNAPLQKSNMTRIFLPMLSSLNLRKK
jgi:hypothetical protein